MGILRHPVFRSTKVRRRVMVAGIIPFALSVFAISLTVEEAGAQSSCFWCEESVNSQGSIVHNDITWFIQSHQGYQHFGGAFGSCAWYHNTYGN
jgi:hypothetical protein